MNIGFVVGCSRLRVHVLVKGFQLWEKIFEIEQRQIGRTCLIRCHGLLHHDRKCGSLRLIRSLRKLPTMTAMSRYSRRTVKIAPRSQGLALHNSSEDAAARSDGLI